MKRPPVFRQQIFRPRRARRPGRPHPRLKGLSINHLLPNVLTVLALCSGLTAIRFAMQERWEPAVIAIVIAAILDALDGRIARLLNGQSKFGAELDSLSDAISFGVAPAFMMYLWGLNGAGSLGWIAAMAYAVCCALRLARFNSRLGVVDLPPWAYNYFTGVPAPAGAGLVLLPMILGFEIGPQFPGHPAVIVPWTLLIGGLMVSTLPTFSFKGAQVPAHWVVPALAGVGLLAAMMVSQPWWTLSIVGIAYMVSLPFSIAQFRKLQRAAELMRTEIGEEAPDAQETESQATEAATSEGEVRKPV
ncbi:CDP-diacylglycerol--serine O-phosphatidyltransferase [Azospirillum lipoferum]|uniref:Phosphatidylcholine/phosphatidylserine synthase n=1 Tax=Azospirillum lipoferum TaxID=193 RepID=A0A5A9GVE3_AZOLI|nr:MULTISPECIES: phosphatidylcholine/phosphatidylserine synthase [Azospirillum]KAA0598333.1 phosphatidylcholine/phosphatidylserine synthase [Azospirillum lipoferum]MCP1609679.1 CDP-diacylglycerol--serine O-phosphatidyltransferase [Azospirillum lipoferum]MDW5535014.1 phosphatidylcholine/phosphatidylserine synthase [Azospirillum sp. NL1]